MVAYDDRGASIGYLDIRGIDERAGRKEEERTRWGEYLCCVKERRGWLSECKVQSANGDRRA
jgi:hypothetical protein